MTALLVQPRAMRWFWQWSPPPLGLLSMAAAAPGTRVIDCAQSGQEEADVIADHRPDIVGVTAFTSTRMILAPSVLRSYSPGRSYIPRQWPPVRYRMISG